jgi:hypothetical protein
VHCVLTAPASGADDIVNRADIGCAKSYRTRSTSNATRAAAGSPPQTCAFPERGPFRSLCRTVPVAENLTLVSGCEETMRYGCATWNLCTASASRNLRSCQPNQAPTAPWSAPRPCPCRAAISVSLSAWGIWGVCWCIVWKQYTSAGVDINSLAWQVAVLEDKELEFDEILSAPLPKAPLEVTLRAHWLAIEGVQPIIPENPLPEGMDVSGAGVGKKRKGAEGADKEGSAGDKDSMVQEVVSQELQLYYDNVTTAVLQGSPHVLGAALQSLQSDPGLQSLLPYLTQFITDEVNRPATRALSRTALM